MGYIFRIGDMLQTKDGVEGQIINNPYFVGNANDSDKIILRYQLENIDGIFEFNGVCKSLPLIFNQIGRYDFTKKSKIEPLEYVKKTQKMATTLEFKNGELLNTKKGLTDIFEKTLDVEIIDKINEIIKYINDKENN